MSDFESLDDRNHDLLVYGATGYTGGLVAEYLARHAPDGMRVALGGRDLPALERCRAQLPARAREWPLLSANSDDPGGLASLAEASRVVLTTVGPYARLGMPMVRACVEAGTDYVDLSGELPFLRSCIDTYQELAAERGIRLVQTCGWVAAPIDLAVWDLARRAADDGDGDLTDVITLADPMRAGRSGGTLASTLESLAAVRSDPELRRLVDDPYTLSPDRDAEPDLGEQPVRMGFDFDPDLGTWLGPFLYEQLETRVVRRTNALLGHAYGRQFRYREALDLGTGPAAMRRRAQLSVQMAWLPLLMNPRLGGAVEAILRRMSPAPGVGPDEQDLKGPSAEVELIARTSSGAIYREHLEVPMGPYHTTAAAMSQMGIALVLDRDRLPVRAGFLTPAAAGEGILLERLRATCLQIHSK